MSQCDGINNTKNILQNHCFLPTENTLSALIFGKNAMKMPIIHRQRILYPYIQIFWRCFSLCPFLWQLEISRKMENEKKKTGAPIKVHINSSTTIRWLIRFLLCRRSQISSAYKTFQEIRIYLWYCASFLATCRGWISKCSFVLYTILSVYSALLSVLFGAQLLYALNRDPPIRLHSIHWWYQLFIYLWASIVFCRRFSFRILRLSFSSFWSCRLFPG